MINTPKGLRLQIGIFGRRNAGKSSLLNTLSRQETAIVSDVPGTTADPVEKAMEMLPLGPVLLIDTAGLDDDAGKLGELRTEKSRKVFERADMALLVSDAEWGNFEENLLKTLQAHSIPCIAVFNKMDLGKKAPDSVFESLNKRNIPFVCISAKEKTGIDSLRSLILKHAPENFLNQSGMLQDLAHSGDCILLITPIDKEAPKGRMILPQVQAIRDVLDRDAWCIVSNEKRITQVLSHLKTPPVLAVTDSQAFEEVSQQLPQEIALTSFSILLARLKGDLPVCARGAAAIDHLTPSSRVLIAEACSHHPIGEDIGTVKIPRWLRKKVGAELTIDHVQGHDFPEDLSAYDLVIHCGACTFNRKEVLTRILECDRQGIPFTNYGTAIAQCLGILERALAPFPQALEAYRMEKNHAGKESSGKNSEKSA